MDRPSQSTALEGAAEKIKLHNNLIDTVDDYGAWKPTSVSIT
jgi:hypothetical protein